MSASFFEVKNLKVTRGNDFSISIPQLSLGAGEWCRIEAPSGFGKSTLVRALAGIPHENEKVTGEVKLNGRSIENLPPHLRNVGVVFQDQHLFPHMTAYENATYGLSIRKVPLQQRREIAEKSFSKFKIFEKLDYPIVDLSGGERQRVAILRAILWNPSLLLLDEPFNGLDPAVAAEILSHLKALVSNSAMSVIWISHTQGEDLDWVKIRLKSGGTQHARIIGPA